MTTRTMSTEEFTQLLDTLGAKLSDWPVDQRQAAEALLAGSEKAVSLFAEARALDVSMRQAQPKAPPGLADRIVAASGATKVKPKP